MVALRRRNVSETTASPVDVPVAGAGGQGADFLAGSAPTLPDIEDIKFEKSDDGVLRQQLRELQRAEQAVQEHMTAQQAQIEAQMRLERDQPRQPQYSERDLAFMGARPGVEKNPEFLQMAMGLPTIGVPYGTDKFYSMLESAFPVSDFR